MRGGLYVQIPEAIEIKVVAFREGRLGRKYVELAVRQTAGSVEGWKTEQLRVGDIATVSLEYSPTLDRSKA